MIPDPVKLTSSMNVTSVLKEPLPWKNTKNPGAGSVGRWVMALIPRFTTGV